MGEIVELDEHRNKIRITSGGPSVLMNGNSKVRIVDCIVFVQDGEVVGRMDGEFDFSAVPPDLHALAANILLGRRSMTHLRSVRPEPPEPEPLNKPWWAFWR